MSTLSSRLRSNGLSAALSALAVVLGLLTARAPFPFIAVGLGGMALVVGTLLEPLVGVGGALLLGPLRAWLEIAMPGGAAYLGQAVLLLAIGSWLVSGLSARKVRVPYAPTMAPLLAFLAVALISLWRPVDPSSGGLEFLKWAQVLLVALLVYDRIGLGAHHARLAIVLVAGSAAFQAAVGLWQFALRGDGVEQFAINDRFYRAYGTFQQPNPYAGLLGLVGPLLLGIAVVVLIDHWRTSGWRSALARALLPAVPAGLIVVGLVASWSRGGWMGFGAAGLVLLVLLPRRPIYGLALVAVMVVAVGGLALTRRLPGAIVNRLTSFTAYVSFQDVRGVGVTDENFAVMERMAHWQAALEMWRSRFWLGVGVGNYEAAYADYALINWPLPLGHAHNTYLNLLAETGLLGLLAYLSWLGTMTVVSIRGALRLNGWTRGLATGLAGAWVHLAVHSLVDNLMVNNVHIHVGVLVALTAYVASASREAST